MAENTDEEHLNIPTNNQPENSSEEITPTADTEIINPNQETENMEVHHHPDLHHKPKKWKEYFLEFLMIFLAVTLGFFAENIREYFGERKKEKEYMESYVKDLQSDISELDEMIPRQNLFATKMSCALQVPIDSLKNITFQHKFYNEFVYFYTYDDQFIRHDNTLTQLKNSGGFSLIKSNRVLDSLAILNLYYERYVKVNEIYYYENGKKVVDIGTQVMKMSPLDNYGDTLSEKYAKNIEIFTSNDPEKLEHLYSWIRNLNATIRAYTESELEYKQKADRLKDFIIKEYHLKSE